MDEPWQVCPNCKKLKKESEPCPHCGWSPGQIVEYSENIGKTPNVDLLPENIHTMSNEVLRRGIEKSLSDLKIHEAGTGIGNFNLLIFGTAGERMMSSMLKAIVDQNKIIIRQNELMIRALERLNSRADAP